MYISIQVCDAEGSVYLHASFSVEQWIVLPPFLFNDVRTEETEQRSTLSYTMHTSYIIHKTNRKTLWY
jgi:hypothetical protein